MKTSDLTDTALDWAVARCEGVIKGDALDTGFILEGAYTPSTDWAQGGPIIEREGISLMDGWSAYTENLRNLHQGPTPLIAAMRCYVASQLGDDIDIPDTLR